MHEYFTTYKVVPFARYYNSLPYELWLKIKTKKKSNTSQYKYCLYMCMYRCVLWGYFQWNLHSLYSPVVLQTIPLCLLYSILRYRFCQCPAVRIHWFAFNHFTFNRHTCESVVLCSHTQTYKKESRKVIIIQ